MSGSRMTITSSGSSGEASTATIGGRARSCIPPTATTSSISPDEVVELFMLNAFWCGSCGSDGNGYMVFGEGLPPRFFLSGSGQTRNYFSASFDIVAHELHARSHAVHLESDRPQRAGRPQRSLLGHDGGQRGVLHGRHRRAEQTGQLPARRGACSSRFCRAASRERARSPTRRRLAGSPITTVAASPVPRTAGASTSTRPFPATPFSSRSRAEPTARPGCR